MNQEFKTKWVEALRSGEYSQGKGQLKQRKYGTDLYCCFGVAACLLVENHEGVWITNDAPSKIPYFNVFAFDDDLAASDYRNLPTDALHSIGLCEDDEKTLIALNDDHEWTFEKIADYIETNL